MPSSTTILVTTLHRHTGTRVHDPRAACTREFMNLNMTRMGQVRGGEPQRCERLRHSLRQSPRSPRLCIVDSARSGRPIIALLVFCLFVCVCVCFGYSGRPVDLHRSPQETSLSAPAKTARRIHQVRIWIFGGSTLSRFLIFEG